MNFYHEKWITTPPEAGPKKKVRCAEEIGRSVVLAMKAFGTRTAKVCR